MSTFSKIYGVAGAAIVFAGMAFGQVTCTGGAASQSPLVRVEGKTELVGEYTFNCSAGGATINILDIVSLPVTSKVLATSSPFLTEAVAVVSGAGGGTYQGTVNGSQVTFSNVVIPAAGATVTIANIRVDATGLVVGSGTPPAITESAFINGAGVNSGVTASGAVAYAFTGLAPQSVSTAFPYSSSSKGANAFLVCQAYKTAAGLVGTLQVGENFATAFKGATAANATLGSEFTSNTETGFQAAVLAGGNVASAGTIVQVVFSNIPSVDTLYVPVSITADQNAPAAVPPVLAGTLTLVASPSTLTPVAASTSTSAAAGTAALTASAGSATAYYLFTPNTNSSQVTETFSIPSYIVQSANTVAATSTAMTAQASFAPVGSTQIPNFVVGPSSTTVTLSAFTQCTTSLLFPFVTNQLGFDTGLAIANTSTDPFGSRGAGGTQSGTCTLNFYGAGAPTPASVTTANVPSGTVFTQVLSGVAAGFQGYIIAQCQFQFAHGFAFITDGVGVNGGLSQGYLAGVIPDTNQVKRTTANPIGSVTAVGQGETLGN
jgi:hypothetical protein